METLIGYIRDASSPVYLIIHNLDAPCLRNSTDQAALARLASCRNVRLIATIEHPMSSLLHAFDDLEGFQFLWHHVPTFLPLMHETVAVKPVLAAQRGEEVKQSAGDVLQVLTQGARAVRGCPLIAWISDTFVLQTKNAVSVMRLADHTIVVGRLLSAYSSQRFLVSGHGGIHAKCFFFEWSLNTLVLQFFVINVYTDGR